METHDRQILIGTCTMYPEARGVRYELALRLLEERWGRYPIIVVDRSLKDPAVRKAFRDRGALLIEFDDPHAPHGEQQRLLFSTMYAAMALSGRVGIYTQPEKVTITNLFDDLATPVINGWADLVLGARTQASLNSYPQYMTERELETNRVYAECTGLTGFDPTFSVYAFSTRALRYFMTCRPAEYGIPDMWIDLLATIRVHKAGLALMSVPVDFRYPPEQLKDELRPDNDAVREKRALQQDVFTRGCKVFAGIK